MRNRLIWIGVLSVAFAGVQLVSSRRKAEQERVAYLTDKLTPIASQCSEQSKQPAHGALALQLLLVPDGKLRAIIERVEVSAASEVKAPELAECIRDRAQALTILQVLRTGPEQIELILQL